MAGSSPLASESAAAIAATHRAAVPVRLEFRPDSEDECPDRTDRERRSALTDPRLRQRIRYLRASDGGRLAWAEVGAGRTLVKASNWLSHLEFEWESPVWRHWTRFFAERFRFVRYDERGCGLSERELPERPVERWFGDFEEIADAAGGSEPRILLGISQGAAAATAFAVRHPERVERLILYGGYALGWRKRGTESDLKRYRAIVDLVEQGWGSENPVFRQLFTSRFIPEATAEQIAWFNELCRRTTHAAAAARLLDARGDVDITALLPRVAVPTLVVHAVGDEVVPVSEGRRLATEIPGAEYVELDSRNHILLEEEGAWARFREAVEAFTGTVGDLAGGEDPLFGPLSPREREVLGELADGRSNAEIAARLAIGEKTVRNHLSNLFAKLGVSTRAQAIVLARDRGFRG